MRAKEIELLAKKYFIPNLPGFSVKGWLIYAAPVEYFLRGFAFETSAFQKTRFNVSAFVQPLYIPTSYVWLSLGNRLGALGGRQERWWNIEEGAQQVAEEVLRYMRTEGLPFLDKIHSPHDFVKKDRELTTAPDDPTVKEAWCYALILAGEYPKGSKELEHLSRSIDNLRMQRPDIHWLNENRKRVLEVLDALQIGPDSAREILNRWRAETLAKIKLTHEI